MTTRSERYAFEQDASKSRVARNQELYEQIYASDSYFQNDDKPSNIERTNEIDIEKVRELLKGREIYRREMKMREINMGNSENTKEEVHNEELEEKNYDINAYLDKASTDRVVEPYHKIDPEILAEPEEVEEDENDEPSLEELKEMGTTALSLEMFSDLSSTSELEDTDEYEEDESDEDDNEELVATITETNAFFTDSVKLSLDDEEDEDDDEKASPVLKIVMVLLILVIVGLVVYLILM